MTTPKGSYVLAMYGRGSRAVRFTYHRSDCRFAPTPNGMEHCSVDNLDDEPNAKRCGWCKPDADRKRPSQPGGAA